MPTRQWMLLKNKLMKKILVLCTGNSCRSQIAHGYLQHFAGNRAEIYSAGVETHGVNPRAIATMKADGIDISSHTSNHINEYLSIPFDYVITVCDHAKEQCPILPGAATTFHHNFTDPSKVKDTVAAIEAAFAATREEIKTYCRDFCKAYL